MPEIAVKKLNEIRNAALEAAEWITRAYSPQWKARMDVAKSLIPIASGALVLTIAFAPSLAPVMLTTLGGTVLLAVGFASSAL